jgi:group I intron endonuclease
MGIIYSAINKTNNKVYIGKTLQSLEARKKEHLRDSKKRNTYFHAAISKYGIDGLKWSVIEDKVEPSSLSETEMVYIDLFGSAFKKRGYNLTLGGEGVIPNKETLEKMKNSHLGQRGYWKGKKFSKEHCENIGKSKKGQVAWNKGTRGIMGSWNKGLLRSEEYKHKISISLKGKNSPFSKRVKCIETGEIFECTRDPSIKTKYKVGKSIIQVVCSGKQKTAGGYHWCYVGG